MGWDWDVVFEPVKSLLWDGRREEGGGQTIFARYIMVSLLSGTRKVVPHPTPHPIVNVRRALMITQMDH